MSRSITSILCGTPFEDLALYIGVHHIVWAGFPGFPWFRACPGTSCYGFGPLSRWVHCIEWRGSPYCSVPTLHAWRYFLLPFVSCLFGPFVMALVCRPGGYILYMVISSRIFTSTLIYISMSHSICFILCGILFGRHIRHNQHRVQSDLRHSLQ